MRGGLGVQAAACQHHDTIGGLLQGTIEQFSLRLPVTWTTAKALLQQCNADPDVLQGVYDSQKRSHGYDLSRIQGNAAPGGAN